MASGQNGCAPGATVTLVGLAVAITLVVMAVIAIVQIAQGP